MTAYNLRDLAYEGKGEIRIPVTGLERYNSPICVELAVKRKEGDRFDGNPNPYWSFNIDSDSGYSQRVTQGYDPIQAFQNLSEAFKQAAELATELMTKTDSMEIIFQEGEAYRAEQYRIKVEEERAAREADTAVGIKLAKRVIEHMKVEGAKLLSWSELDIRAYDRGSRKERIIKVTRSRRGLLLFSEHYNRISKKSAIEIIADSHLGSLEVSNINFGDPTLVKFLMKQ